MSMEQLEEMDMKNRWKLFMVKLIEMGLRL